jgi:hypothetical protein
MEMPELFGTDYLLPAIIIVVLLIALLVLLVARRRGAAPQPKKAAKTSAAAGAATGEAYVPAGQAEATAEVTAAGGATPPQAAPAPGLSASAAGKAPRGTTTRSADPLTVVLTELLEGWGDLTVEDTKRLEVFRPEKVIAAIAALELPKSKSNDYARTRLTQLRQYAGDLERRLKAPAPQTDEVEAASEEATPVTAAEAAPPAEAVAPAAAPAVAKAASPEATWYAPPEPEPAVPAIAGAGPAGASPAAALAVGAAVVAASSEKEETPVKKELSDVESFWAEPEAGWQPAQEVIFEEAPPPVFRETTIPLAAGAAALAAAGAAGAGDRPPGEQPADAAASAAAAAPAHPGAQVLAGAISAGLDPLSRLRVKIQNAADLLALPPEEQADMVAFLEPHDLAAVFRATRNTEVKLAVIDTLAHIGSPASLSALGSCLDDPDRNIQLYALDAADRLLRTGD